MAAYLCDTCPCSSILMSIDVSEVPGSILVVLGSWLIAYQVLGKLGPLLLLERKEFRHHLPQSQPSQPYTPSHLVTTNVSQAENKPFSRHHPAAFSPFRKFGAEASRRKPSSFGSFTSCRRRGCEIAGTLSRSYDCFEKILRADRRVVIPHVHSGEKLGSVFPSAITSTACTHHTGSLNAYPVQMPAHLGWYLSGGF